MYTIGNEQWSLNSIKGRESQWHHACGDISIQEILYRYQDIDNYIAIIDITIILHITTVQQFARNADISATKNSFYFLEMAGSRCN